MQPFLWYIFGSVATSAVFIAAGLRSTSVTAAYSTPRFDSGWQPSEPSVEALKMPQFGNVDASLKMALERLGPLMTARQVKLDVTTPPDLMVQLSPSALADILEELISTTIQYAAAERLLLTAWERASRIAIRVIDDVAAADPDIRQRSLHSLMERIAMHCSTVDIDVQPSGAIVTIWLGGVDRGALSNR